ncbi:MAG TPA: flagellar export protein FliJ [Steroidobacteraceae bacterium]|jgi:flagellar FliJ protein
MTRAQRIKPVQTLVEDAERKLQRSLAGAQRQLVQAEAKLAELERYCEEYRKQFAERALKGMDAPGLRDYQVFLARLNEAIRQQQAIVARARAERDAERQRWQRAATRAKALGHVVEQWRIEEQRIQDRREQREIDERAQRQVSRP